MTRRIDHQSLTRSREIVAQPMQRANEDRTFELPPALHIASALLFVGFVSVLSFAFRNPGIAVPYAIFIVSIAAIFVVPGLWAAMAPDRNNSRALDWSEFRERGIATETGRTSATEATVLVLLLPLLIMLWAVAVAIITALT